MARVVGDGDEGALAMVCDSTNVFVAGHAGSEAEVRDALLAEAPQTRQKSAGYLATAWHQMYRLGVEPDYADGWIPMTEIETLWKRFEPAQKQLRSSVKR